MKGFTLIEIMVTIAVMVILLGGVIAGFSSFNDSQKVKQAALTLKSDLRFARSYAATGKKPTSCTGDTLAGYRVSFDSSSYAITPYCKSGDTESAVVIEAKTVLLPEGVSFSPIPPAFQYYPLTQGVRGAPSSITLTNGASTKPVTVTILLNAFTGEVSD